MALEKAELEAIVQKNIQDLFKADTGTVEHMLHIRFTGIEADGAFTYLCAADPLMRNTAGVLHGGMIAMMCDTTMGVTAGCFSSDHALSPTSDLAVYYHRPIPVGGDLVSRVSVVHAGAHLLTMRATLFLPGEPGAACASATGVFFLH